MIARYLPLALLFPSMLLAEPPTTTALGLRIPAGFEVTEFADGKLAPDISR